MTILVKVVYLQWKYFHTTNFLLFMKMKILYVVIADPSNEYDDSVICAVCDNRALACSICEDVSSLFDSFCRVYISEYALNCLKI